LASACACACSARAAEPDWVKLQAPSFGLVSQLDAEETRKWAVEFEQFIDAMHQLFAVDQANVVPLTIVLFRDSKRFAPYRLQTDSGTAEVGGFFGRTGTWSVIGMPDGRSDAATRHVIQHEAVHWFASATDEPLPLWFSEGLAEALATFRVVDGKGRWGQAIAPHARYLYNAGLLPIEDVLRASQDDAFHGAQSDKYYPEAWAFVHYLMFGSEASGRQKLQALLRGLKTSDLDSAFEAAFAAPYADVTSELKRYLGRGRYNYAEIELRDRSAEMTVQPASPANVEFALARLAAAGGNFELAAEHVERVLELVPSSPVGHEMRAFVAVQTDEAGAALEAAQIAIELGSRDALVYLIAAEDSLRRARADAALDEVLPAAAARATADLYGQAIALQPRSAAAYSGLVTALLSVDSLTDTDADLLRTGRALFPADGIIVVGQALRAKHQGDTAAATELLRQAGSPAFTLPPRYRSPLAALHMAWFAPWVLAEVEHHVAAGNFGAARTFIDTLLADETVVDQARTLLDNLRLDLSALESVYDAGRGGDVEDFRRTLAELAADEQTSPNVRRAAENLLRDTPTAAP
jgi:tetratricopeptide (TPR) repeat protein